SDLIQHIKQRLKEKISTRVVSTQLIEAGVDVDFPVVYRALAGLDSIAQAAGRCNREQTLAQGDVVVFIAPQPAPAGYLRKAEDACREVLQTHTGEPLQRELFARYFTHLYRNCNLDARQITQDLTVDATTLGINFRSAAAKFQLIPEDGSTPVIVRYRGLDGTDDTINSLLNRLKKEGPQRWLMRKLQRYTVTVRQHDAQRLLVQGDIEEHIPGLFIQVSDWLYDPNLGLMVDGKPLGLGEFVVCDIKDDPLEADILGFAEEAASHIKGWT
ncbi:MAG: CRISPR-associated helicase/endonuclease Cas3, partial [Pseudomonadota bacterium]